MKTLIITTLVLALFIAPLSSQRCYVGGCSSQLCTNNPNAISTCEWRPEYACYATAQCRRQDNGRCGWTKTPELQQCLHNPGQCYVGGCSSQLCSDDPNLASTCEWRDEYACYKDATCERQDNGQCGWTSTPELNLCLGNPLGQCYVGGCSSQLCSDDPNAMSTCEWTDSYACYKDATCERQDSGECGWTRTPELEHCLESPPGQCYVGGCSGQLCSDDPNAISTCEWTDRYACYKDATCERQGSGQCGWTKTEELAQCLKNPGPCYKGGCSGQLCTNDPNAVSTCEWTDRYACYGGATCEIQGDGQCGWTVTSELEECLENPPSPAS